MSESVNETVSTLIRELDRNRRGIDIPAILILCSAIASGGVALYKVNENTNEITIQDSRLSQLEKDTTQIKVNEKEINLLRLDNIDSQKARAQCRQQMITINKEVEMLHKFLK